MKEIEFKPKIKCYEFSDSKTYYHKNCIFNEYGHNKNNDEENNPINFTAKTGPNCVKRQIKR